MAGQMAELLKKAFAEKGVQLPGAKVETRKVLPTGSGESSQHTGQSAETPTVSPRQLKAPTAPKEGKRSDPIAEVCKKWRAEHPVARAKAPVKSSQRAALACYDSSPVRAGKSPEGKVSPYEVRLGSAARFAPHPRRTGRARSAGWSTRSWDGAASAATRRRMTSI